MLETLLNELKKQVSFKSNTEVGDVVVIMSEGNGFTPDQIRFGHVKTITPDQKKKGWFMLEILLIHVPFKRVILHLLPEYFTGKEFFAVNNTKSWVGAVNDLVGQEIEEEKKPVILKLLPGGKNGEESSD